MNRRGFLQSLALAGAAIAADPDPEQLERLLWRPKLISIPAPPPAWESYLVTLIRRDLDKHPDLLWRRLNAGVLPAGDPPTGARVTTHLAEMTLGQFRERLGLTPDQFEQRYAHVIDSRPMDFLEAHLEGSVRPGPSPLILR